MGGNFFSQRQHALLDREVVLAQQAQCIGLIHAREQRAQQQAGVIGLIDRHSDPRRGAAQVGPVLLQRITVQVDNLKYLVRRPARQILHQQQMNIAAGFGQGMMCLHLFYETLNLGFDLEALPGIHQQGWGCEVVHVNLTQYTFAGIAHSHDFMAHFITDGFRPGSQPAQQFEPFPLQRVLDCLAPCTVVVMLQSRLVDPDFIRVPHAPFIDHRVEFDLINRTMQRQIIFIIDTIKTQFTRYLIAQHNLFALILKSGLVPQINGAIRLSPGEHCIAQGLAQARYAGTIHTQQ